MTLQRLQFDEAAGRWQAALEGELDVFEAPKLLDAFERVLSERPAGVTLDCTALSYIDSMGLGALVKLTKRAEAAGGTVRLTGLIPRVKKIFAITGLLETFGMEEGNG